MYQCQYDICILYIYGTRGGRTLKGYDTTIILLRYTDSSSTAMRSTYELESEHLKRKKNCSKCEWAVLVVDVFERLRSWWIDRVQVSE